MPKVRVAAFSLSLDGYAAGPRQDLHNPLGVRGSELHNWFFQTEVFKKIHDRSGTTIGTRGIGSIGTTGIDNDFAVQSFENVGAWILGRNMFGPVRGPWTPDPATGEIWKGWWGPNPPFHTPVFVLTHHARPPLEMEDGTTFHFVTEGIDPALQQAKSAAQIQGQNKDVRIGGGVATIRQFLLAGHIDEMHFAISPVLLGEGEHLLHKINLHQLGYKPIRVVQGENAIHVFLNKK